MLATFSMRLLGFDGKRTGWIFDKKTRKYWSANSHSVNPCPTEDRFRVGLEINLTSLFAGVRKFCGTRVARFFKNGGTRGKKRRNSNKNDELRVPPRCGTALGHVGHGRAGVPSFRFRVSSCRCEPPRVARRRAGRLVADLRR